MKFFRSLLVGALASAFAFAPIAQAQTPQNTDATFPAQFRTYAATKIALTPAASATDFFTITGAANKRVRIINIHCDGTSTAAATALIQIVKRSAANTGGTSGAQTAVPFNSGPDVAASASVLAYTVNPASLGTAIGPIAEGELTTNTVATSAINNTGVTFDFSNQWVYLNSAAEVIGVNANAASFSSGASLNCSVQWAEG